MIFLLTPRNAWGQSPKTPQVNMTQLHMTSEMNGWAFVETPDPFDTHPSFIGENEHNGMLGYVMLTRDGGLTWRDVSPPTPIRENRLALCGCTDNGIAGTIFLDDQHAIVLTQDARVPGNQITWGLHLWRTADAGQSWAPADESLVQTWFIDAVFTDNKHGWIITSSIENTAPLFLYQTTDGGVSWVLRGLHSDVAGPIISPKTPGGKTYYGGMASDKPGTLWVAWTNADTTDTNLLRTRDGGRTWAPVTLPSDTPVGKYPQACASYDLHLDPPHTIGFTSDCSAVEALPSPRIVLIRTRDDGKTWQTFSLPNNLYPYWRYYSEQVPVTLWMMGCAPGSTGPCDNPANATRLYRSMDGGKTWEMRAPLPDGLHIIEGPLSIHIGLDFITARTGWAWVPSSELLRTSDGGQTWTRFQPKFNLTLPLF
jgi:photosystem II stability/assembly factor-like uncharacterized protein